MRTVLLRMALYGLLAGFAGPCAQTSTAATPTTAAPTTTTTVLTTTTTVLTTTTTSACQSCSLNSITLTPGDGTNTATPVPALSTDANGCLVLTVTCTAPTGRQTFMQFNVNQGGPVQPTGAVVSAALNCVNGQWVYAPGGGLPSRVITEVNCVNT